MSRTRSRDLIWSRDDTEESWGDPQVLAVMRHEEESRDKMANTLVNILRDHPEILDAVRKTEITS